ncbi:MAG: hypothetical protein JW836_13375 [Deltaproteobacteria bacterium]|nr:hypothetical protein [Deltaproteobacteria bacterium]
MMGKKTIQQITEAMSPETALKELAKAARNLLTFLDEKARLDFVKNLVDDAETDKVASLVHL